jgi:hypothetical protein
VGEGNVDWWDLVDRDDDSRRRETGRRIAAGYKWAFSAILDTYVEARLWRRTRARVAAGASQSVGMLSAANSAAVGDWVVEGVRDFDYTVGSVVPVVFDAYARVFHPASRGPGEDAVDVRWGEVAAGNGRVMHGAAEWGSLTGSWQLGAQSGMWDVGPSVGALPQPLAKRLAAILEKHTTSAERCCFAVAEGSGALTVTFFVQDGSSDELIRRERQDTEAEIAAWSALIESGAPFRLPNRRMSLLEGSLAAIDAFYEWYRSPPSLWWPDDRAWCIGTGIDLMTTYVGGSMASIDALLADDQLESLAVSVDQRVDWEADTINPLPAPP